MSVTIPYQQTADRQLNQFQQALRSALQPITSLPTSSSTILTNIALVTGQVNTINTGLGYPLSGWYIIRQRAQAVIWDSQDSNTNPNNTLILNTSANVTVDIIIF